jgi:deoxyguanosine kinase
MIPHKFIAVEGIIGAGKSSLVKKIATYYKIPSFYEQFEDNSFLPKFYENPIQNAFPLELSFLADRYNQVKKHVSNLYIFDDLVISDYYFGKSLVFARVNLQPDEYALYSNIFQIMNGSLPKPDLLVYLYLNPENAIKNIISRGRSYEQNIQLDYLIKIQEGYLDYFKKQNEFSVIVIDSNKLDFVNNINDFYKILKVIESQYNRGINRVLV